MALLALVFIYEVGMHEHLVTQILFVKRLAKICAVGKKKKNKNTPIYFNRNYRTEMKLVPIIID